MIVWGPLRVSEEVASTLTKTPADRGALLLIAGIAAFVGGTALGTVVGHWLLGLALGTALFLVLTSVGAWQYKKAGEVR